MSGNLHIEFAQDMPAAAVEVVSPAMEVVGRVMLAGGRAAEVHVPSEASFLRVHLPEGRVVTLRDDGNMSRMISQHLLYEPSRTPAITRGTPSSVAAVARGHAIPGRFPLVASGPREVGLVAPESLAAPVQLFDGHDSPIEPASSNPVQGSYWSVHSSPDRAPLRLTAMVPGRNRLKVRLPGNLRQVWAHESWAPQENVHLLSVRLSSGQPAADAILGYMQRGDLYSTEAMSQWVEEAEGLLEDKMQDPYAAAVGAYTLLRLQNFDRLRDWPRNLANWFPFLPDGCVVWASQLIGQRQPGTEAEVRKYLLEAAKRGIPVFTEGVRLLLDGLRLIGSEGVGAREKLMNDLGIVLWDSPVTAMLETGAADPAAISPGKQRFDIGFGAAPAL